MGGVAVRLSAGGYRTLMSRLPNMPQQPHPESCAALGPAASKDVHGPGRSIWVRQNLHKAPGRELRPLRPRHRV